MKFLILASLLLSPSAFAITVNSSYTANAAGAYVKETQVLCDGTEVSLCQNLCHQDTDCRRVEPYCLNCAGTTSGFLRTLFTQISQNYTASQRELSSEQVMQYLGNQSYILIGAKSVFNYYNTMNSGEFLVSMQALCPLSSDEPLLVIKLNSERWPEKLSFILCKGSDQASKAFEVDLLRPSLGGGQVFGNEIRNLIKLELKNN
ncbi:hypothetical protein D3C87_1220430 [compost metagenome]